MILRTEETPPYGPARRSYPGRPMDAVCNENQQAWSSLARENGRNLNAQARPKRSSPLDYAVIGQRDPHGAASCKTLGYIETEGLDAM